MKVTIQYTEWLYSLPLQTTFNTSDRPSYPKIALQNTEYFKHITNLNELDGNSGLNGENPEQESISLVLAFISIA